MSNTKPTPGPWASETRMGARTVMKGQFTVAHVDTEANARLIAAAPDLLAALEAEQEWRDRERDGALDPEWDYEAYVGAKRRAALAKAGA